jgi:hypothetical protein
MNYMLVVAPVAVEVTLGVVGCAAVAVFAAVVAVVGRGAVGEFV